MMKQGRLLLVEDSDIEKHIIAEALRSAGYSVIPCATIEDAHSELAESEFDIVLLDLLLAREFEPTFHLISEINKHVTRPRIIVLSAHGTIEHAIRAVRTGAWGFVEKPAIRPYSEDAIRRLLLPKIEEALADDDYLKMEKRTRLLQLLSEDQFIDRILMPLLRKMGYYGIHRISSHGPGEYGTDITPFYKYGDFGERIYYAAQVKNGKVTLKGGEGTNVHILLDQVKSALTQSFVDRFDNRRKNIDHCLAICSGPITNDARMILEEASEGCRDIIILEGVDIIGLLAKYNMSQYFDRVIEELFPSLSTP